MTTVEVPVERQRWRIAFAVVFVLLGYVRKLVPFPTDNAQLFWTYELSAAVAPLVVLGALGVLGALRPRDYYADIPRDLKILAWRTAVAFCSFCIPIFVLRDWIWGIIWRLNLHTVELEGKVFQEVESPVSIPFFLVDLVANSVVEEIVYRGLLFEIIRSRFFFVIASSILFAGIHSNQGLLGMVQAGLFGFLACLLFLRWKTIVPLALAHCAINLVALVRVL